MSSVASSLRTDSHPDHAPHECPPWIAWFLASPVRRLLEDPKRVLAPVRSGDTVLEVGPGYGFYTFPAARLVGNGRVVCVDVQHRMLDELGRRARRRRLDGRIELRHVDDCELGADLDGAVGMVLAINVVHESRTPARLMECMARTMKPGASLVLAEPRHHCTQALFEAELGWGEAAALRVQERGVGRMSYSAVLVRT